MADADAAGTTAGAAGDGSGGAESTRARWQRISKIGLIIGLVVTGAAWLCSGFLLDVILIPFGVSCAPELVGDPPLQIDISAKNCLAVGGLMIPNWVLQVAFFFITGLIGLAIERVWHGAEERLNDQLSAEAHDRDRR